MNTQIFTISALLVVTVAIAYRAPPMLRVIDGDTVEIGENRIRLATHDAPELFHPKCAKEYRLAELAKERLLRLLTKPYSLEYVKCATRPSQESMLDRYGRFCGVFRIEHDGTWKDVGDVLVDEGLAVKFGNGKPEWCK